MGHSEALYSGVFDSCPEHWNVVSFEEAVDFREGPGILAKDFCDDGIPLLRLRNIERPYVDMSGCNFLEPNMVDAKWSHFRVEVGDLLVSTSGTLGRVSIATDDAAGAIPYTGIIRMRPAEEGICAGFIRYFLTSPMFQQQAEASAAGSVLRHFGPSHLREMSFPVPPREEQRAIADILGALDEKIELNRQMNRTLEAMARAIFKAWFVDFEPVKAKAAGATSFRGMPQPVFDQLPDRFTDTELGPVPEGWRLRSLADVVSITKGRSYKSSELVEGDTALVTLKSFKRGGGYRQDGLKPYNGNYKPEQVVNPSELVVAFTDVTQQAEVIGKPALVLTDPRYETLVASLDTAIVRPLSNDVTTSFLYCLFRTEEFQAHTYSHTSGTTVLHLGKNALPTYQFVCPPGDVAESFEQLASDAFAKVEQNDCESRTLAAIRDTLLPKLISGELRVPAAEEGADGG